MTAERRMTITLKADAAQVLDALATRTGRSKNEVIRAALFLEQMAQEAWAAGDRLVVERGGASYELIPH